MLSDLATAKRQQKAKAILSNIGAAGFLIALFYHSYSFFTHFYDSAFMGLCVAAAIDATTYGALFRRREMQDTGELGITAWIIFILCFASSMFTNFHESFVSSQGGAEMTVASLQALDVMQKIRLSIGALIPPLLMFLSLVLASSKGEQLKTPANQGGSYAPEPIRQPKNGYHKEPVKMSGFVPAPAPAPAETVSTDGFNSLVSAEKRKSILHDCKRILHTKGRYKGAPNYARIGRLNNVTKQTAQDVHRLDLLADFLANNPGASVAKMAGALNVSNSVIRRLLSIAKQEVTA